MRIVDIDDNTFMVVDEQGTWNRYSVFRDNILIADEAIKRKNVCSICGYFGWIANEQVWTHMHHTKLNPCYPTHNLVEVCNYGGGNCHDKIHKGELKV
jgi:hypothetical protein